MLISFFLFLDEIFFIYGMNDIHTRWLFSVEHDPLTLSAG